MLELINPVGIPRVQAQAARRSLNTPVGRRLGIIYNQYPVTRGFWAQLERSRKRASRRKSSARTKQTRGRRSNPRNSNRSRTPSIFS